MQEIYAKARQDTRPFRGGIMHKILVVIGAVTWSERKAHVNPVATTVSHVFGIKRVYFLKRGHARFVNSPQRG